MKTAGLSFDNIPYLRIPFGFFSTAPVFGMLAALLLLVEPAALESRWHPTMLAIVHLLTLGFAGHCMLGALCQVLPVVSSQSIPLSQRLLLWIRISLGAGTLLLAGFFIGYQPLLAFAALILLTTGLALFVLRLATALVKIKPAGMTVTAIRLAALSLLVTLIAGAMLLWWRADPGSAPVPWLTTDQHALWGTLGWAMLLIIGVSFQVIPMFHVAPDFPRQIQRYLPAALFVLLLLGYNDLVAGSISTGSAIAVKGCILFYCLVAAVTLQRRKRKLIDYTVRFWQLGLGSIGLSMLLSLLQYLPETLNVGLCQRLAALSFGIGGILSIILGMLQKIVPFLMFLHLQRDCLSQPERLVQLPTMKQIIPTQSSRRQWQLHLGTIAALVGGLLWPPMAPMAALLLLADFGWLWWSLYRANRLYLSAKHRMD